MGAVKVKASAPLLLKLFDIPYQYDIKGARYDPFSDSVELIIVGSDLPEQVEGSEPKEADIICHRQTSEIKVRE